MKIKTFAVKHFRGISGDKTAISFEKSEIIFLIGQNNTGKSSLLNAYQYLTQAGAIASINDFHCGNSDLPIEIEAWFTKEPGDEDLFADKGLNKWVDENNEIRLRKIWTTPDKAGQKETWDPEKSEYVKNGFGGMDTIFQNIAPKAIHVPAMPKPEDLEKCINDVVKKGILKKLHDNEKTLCDSIKSDIKSLQSKVFSHDDITNLNQVVNEAFQKVFPTLSLRIMSDENQTIDIAKFIEKDFWVHVEDDSREELKAQKLSSYGHGVIRQAIFNFLGLVQQKAIEGIAKTSDRKEYLLLFEEPEIYLHPTSIFRTRNMLYDLCEGSPFQVLCASHSPSLIDLSRPHTSIVRIHRVEDGQTRMHQIGHNVFEKDSERKDHVQMINRFNPHVCESFFVENVILVEGDTEAIIARHIIATKWPEKDVYVLNTGSKNNIPFFQEVFNNFAINYHVIHDCDTKFEYLKDGKTRKKNNDDSDKRNSAWSFNQQILDKILEGRTAFGITAHRYVHVKNFEDAHEYKHDSKKGKPLSAYEFAKSFDGNGDKRIEVILRQIMGEVARDSDMSEAELFTMNGEM